MSRQVTPKSRSSSHAPAGATGDETPANEDETRAYLLKRSKRNNAPIPKYFVQNPDRKLKDRSAPLAEFVRNGDVRGLRAFLFLHAIISSGEGENGWSTTLPLSVWARVFDTTKTATGSSSSTSATKVLTRLVERKLIMRARTGRERKVTLTLLRPDGSSDPYTRPDGKIDKFLKLTNKYWTDGWYDKLDLPATAMLLVALHEKPGFELATAKVPKWYGWSADTAERGLKTLRDLEILEVRTRIKKTPVSPTGATEVNVYTLTGVFAHDVASKKRTKKTRNAGKTPKPTKIRRVPGTRTLRQKYAHLPEALTTAAGDSAPATNAAE